MDIRLKKYAMAIVYLLAGAIGLEAQTTIDGHVYNKSKESLAGASVRIRESGKGVYADSSGYFSLTLAGSGKRNLVVSAVGYIPKEIGVQLIDSRVRLEIELRDSAVSLGDAVVISVGSFEASDKAKGASLTPIDAVTVAGNGGDIANALRFLPGAQQIGEQEGLFVRGGSSEETKQFMDGALVPYPNYASVPGIPQPARLNPFLFKGILFSSGGYSALYGDALSSALILESVDLPEKSSGTFSLFPQNISAGFQDLAKDGNSSYGATARYGNMRLYNSMVPQIPDFYRGPAYFSQDANFRVRTSATGMLKFYGMVSYSNVALRYPDIDSSSLLSSFAQQNTNVYANLTYRESLGNNWKVDAAAAYSFYKNNLTNELLGSDKTPLFLSTYPYDDDNNSIDTRSDFAQARVVLRKQYAHNQALRFGAEYVYEDDRYSSRYATGDTLTHLPDNRIAVFAEGDLYITKNIAAKLGLRAEHSGLLDRSDLAPRLSLAYRFPHGGQINAAYGVFYQKPEIIYLVQNRELNFSSATHYIINYQKKASNRLFRIEAYYKLYDHLVTTLPAAGNNGDGYARGVELFWRDKRTFKDFDYWVTYTYLDTRRKWLDYPSSLQPPFATPHTFSIVLKKYFQDLNLSANMSYSIATGRPYYDIQANPAGKSFLSDQGTTNMYNCMNLSFAYLFSIFPKWKQREYSGIGFGINNVFGSHEVFGYVYNYDGMNKVPETLPAVRAYYIGLFVSFGIDRRDDFINENL